MPQSDIGALGKKRMSPAENCPVFVALAPAAVTGQAIQVDLIGNVAMAFLVGTAIACLPAESRVEPGIDAFSGQIWFNSDAAERASSERNGARSARVADLNA